ncbi:YjbQ family protein [bacterium]|uniref:YjbQ family protein n=1 Tax=candidate division WOR-3 bacterium TaxID=2052148 RepID=A0A7C0VDI8_UNCW3|nr:MAG: YjbQ family protein [bacterium]HDI83728.1 YjbQ family protein [candidate division WOR-3 bacterium]
MINEITIKTGKRNEFVDITQEVSELISAQGVKEGFVILYVPHTTAGITINEHADPSVKRDILNKLEELVPPDKGYTHMEGNADSHIKATLVGNTLTIPISGGRLVLGTWQGIFFCEFDGPRTRKLIVKVVGED